MFKLSKHIFIVFLISTIIPLVLMFFLHHYKVSNDINRMEKKFLDMGVEQFENSLHRHLDMERDFTFNTIENLPYSDIKLEQYKNIFRADEVYFVDSNYKINNKDSFLNINLKEIKHPIAFYELRPIHFDAKPDLVSVIYVPFYKKLQKGLILIKRVPFHHLHPKGPFDVDLYLGKGIKSNTLIAKLEDDFAKTKFHHHEKRRPPHKVSLNFRTIELKNFANKTIVTAALKIHRPHVPFDKFFKFIGSVIILIAAILSVIVGFYIKKNFINPFVLISKASKKLQEGDLTSTIYYKSRHPETRETIDRFNEMVEGLREKEELRHSFITSLTHDLRTPLLAQDRAIDYIIKEFENLSLDEPLALAKGLEQNNKHLLRMVNSLVESYHFDSGEIDIKLQDINLYDLVNVCYEKLSPIASEKNIKLINSVYQNQAPIKTDESILKRVLMNLVANAIDNTNEGEVEIKAKVSETGIEIIVEDNGNGISEEDQKYLFDKYFTGKSNERKIGSGLGLYICKRLLEFNNASIEVESELGKFTRFIITLPQS